MGVVVTYDMGAGGEDLARAMVARGYAHGWTIDGVAYRLPEGTLWHEARSVDEAIEDLQWAASQCGAKLDGAMAVESAPYVVREGADARRSPGERAAGRNRCVG